MSMWRGVKSGNTRMSDEIEINDLLPYRTSMKSICHNKQWPNMRHSESLLFVKENDLAIEKTVIGTCHLVKATSNQTDGMIRKRNGKKRRRTKNLKDRKNVMMAYMLPDMTQKSFPLLIRPRRENALEYITDRLWWKIKINIQCMVQSCSENTTFVG